MKKKYDEEDVVIVEQRNELIVISDDEHKDSNTFSNDYFNELADTPDKIMRSFESMLKEREREATSITFRWMEKTKTEEGVLWQHLKRLQVVYNKLTHFCVNPWRPYNKNSQYELLKAEIMEKTFNVTDDELHADDDNSLIITRLLANVMVLYLAIDIISGLEIKSKINVSDGINGVGRHRWNDRITSVFNSKEEGELDPTVDEYQRQVFFKQ